MTVTPQDLYCYILPGRVADARVGLVEAREAELRGIRGIFLSERWETKELGATMGALSQVTEQLELVAGLTHFGTRHPLALAGLGATLQMLSGNRFVLGFGRSIPALFKRFGIPVFNNTAMADYANILRRLWAGERVSYSGPIGEFPDMRLARPCDTPPRMILGATGPKTLALAGTHFDGIVLHPFLTPEGVARSVEIVRNAAATAGRGSAEIAVYATVVTALDPLSDEERADIVDARAVSYFMHRDLGLMLASMNGWDAAPVDRLIETGIGEVDFVRGGDDGSRRALASAAESLPEHWLREGTATGSASECIARYEQYLAAGASRILLHGVNHRQVSQITSAL